MSTLFDLINIFYQRLFSAFSGVFSLLSSKLVENGLSTIVLKVQLSLVAVAFGLYLLRYLVEWIIERSDFNK